MEWDAFATKTRIRSKIFITKSEIWWHRQKKRLDDNQVQQEALDFELFRKDLESFRTQFAIIERYSEEWNSRNKTLNARITNLEEELTNSRNDNMTLSTKFAEKEKQTRIIIEGVGKQNSELKKPIKKTLRVLIEIWKK